MYTVHSDNMTAETRELFLRSRRLRDEGRDNVFIAAAAECDEAELRRRVEREMRTFLYRLYSAAPGEAPRSGLARACRLARLQRDARLGKNDMLFS